MLEKILGKFEKEKYIVRSVVGIIGVILMVFKLMHDGTLNSQPQTLLITFCVIEGVMYGSRIIALASSVVSGMGEGLLVVLTQFVVLLMGILIAILVGGILFVIDTGRYISLVMQKKSNGNDENDNAEY
mgnify:FL=1